MNSIKLSKTMSYILRHYPGDFNLRLNPDGSVKLVELKDALRGKFPGLGLDDIKEVVAEDKKGRFSLLEDGEKIRANYGHSIEGVNPDYEAVIPPETLYHGTARKYTDSILATGLKSMNRNYTHLSLTRKEAIKVGKRRDNRPVVLEIAARQAYEDGHDYYQAGDSIYLTDWVPHRYINKSPTSKPQN